MWRRAYLLLVLVRLYFALSPSYLHPDEHFQGPEVIAGRVFSYPVHQTWEFTSVHPIRSAFPLWPVYGLPMLILRWLWDGAGRSEVSPSIVYWTLRVLMFTLSFVLEDWAIHDLFDLPRHRRMAVMLIASSFVTWTWQTHTFSNAIETLLVLWVLVIKKQMENKKRERSPILAPAILALLLVFGFFNRPTFLAYVAAPLLAMVPYFIRKPLSLSIAVISGLLATLLAIAVDTSFHNRDGQTMSSHMLHDPVITPWNNIIYNTQYSNLETHGVHPFYQHFLVNLPQLLGPMYLLLFGACRWKSPTFIAAVSGIAFLSIIPHQEARFLLPAIPLLLASIHIPRRHRSWWIAIWLIFNASMGILMGIFHQGGVVPAQTWLSQHDEIMQAFWWKTYSPPIWLLNGRSDKLATVDLMGLNKDALEQTICNTALAGHPINTTVLVAPRSAIFLDQFKGSSSSEKTGKMHLTELWSYRHHINLDDLDFGDDGVVDTLQRVIGRSGLSVWSVTCDMSANLSPLRYLKDW